MIVIIVDADDVLAQRKRDLEVALNAIRDNHLDVNDAKGVLENAIAASTYLHEEKSNQRPLMTKWKLAFEVNLEVLKTICSKGYGVFVQDLSTAAQAVADMIPNS
jgi:5'(3')-deoxyribonucleotidase